jgi:acyl dehydratase
MADPTGEEIERRTFRVTREDLVAYAVASGDHNPIHQDEEVARSVGLPGVIAHGMYTLALAARFLEEWAGPGRVATFGAKFVKPVVVPPEGTDVVVSGVHEQRGDETTVSLSVTCEGVDVLRGCKATLRG